MGDWADEWAKAMAPHLAEDGDSKTILAKLLRRVRADALEEAALIADGEGKAANQWDSGMGPDADFVCETVAERIRALKDKPACG